MQKVIKLTGSSTSPFEVWYDDKKLIRRITQDVKSEQGDFRFTIEFYDYGTPVAVKAPPAGETKDLSELAAKEAEKQAG